MAPSPSPGGPSRRFQSWGPFQPQQASWGQVVSGVAVRLGGPPGPASSHLLLDSIPALMGVPGWSLGWVPPDQLLHVGGHLGGQLQEG